MTISKEERAELRRLVSQEPVKTRDDHATLQTAVVLTLDALDAADERISVLESENRRALGLIDIGLAETAKWQELHGRTEDRLNARIAELEAAAQWRPMDTAPRDGTWLICRSNYSGDVWSVRWDNEDTGYWVRPDGTWNTPKDATLPAWRPLKDAPRDKDRDATFVPIADTYELDRAVQGEIARAFGALIDVLVQNEHAIDPYDDGGSSDCCDAHVTWAIQDVRRILHTAFGGRIPDEVP